MIFPLLAVSILCTALSCSDDDEKRLKIENAALKNFLATHTNTTTTATTTVTKTNTVTQTQSQTQTQSSSSTATVSATRE